jgi:hypothetical protein
LAFIVEIFTFISLGQIKPEHSLSISPNKDHAMEQTQPNNGEPLEPQQAAAKAALLTECDRLAAAGITFVAVHFDGYGDDGTTEEVKCYHSEWYASGEHEPVKYDGSHLRSTSKLLCPSDMKTIAAGSGTWCSMWPLVR